jgi:hypothetical protein
VLFVLLKTNQYRKKTIGRKTANVRELKNINIKNVVFEGSKEKHYSLKSSFYFFSNFHSKNVKIKNYIYMNI